MQRLLKHIINKYNIKDIDMVVAGNATGAGGNITRLMILEAGLPENIPAFTIDMQCGSGLESIAVAAARIQSGQSGCVIAGGLKTVQQHLCVPIIKTILGTIYMGKVHYGTRLQNFHQESMSRIQCLKVQKWRQYQRALQGICLINGF